MRKKAPIEQLMEYSSKIEKAIAHWKDIAKNGCSDPFWSDGCNMNLVRNHIIYYKGKIMDLHEEYGLPFPDAYFSALPPKVDEMYMAKKKPRSKAQIKRYETLAAFHKRDMVYSKPNYDEKQMSFL